jgi:hypothetical protein
MEVTEILLSLLSLRPPVQEKTLNACSTRCLKSSLLGALRGSVVNLLLFLRFFAFDPDAQSVIFPPGSMTIGSASVSSRIVAAQAAASCSIGGNVL